MRMRVVSMATTWLLGVVMNTTLEMVCCGRYGILFESNSDMVVGNGNA